MIRLKLIILWGALVALTPVSAGAREPSCFPSNNMMRAFSSIFLPPFSPTEKISQRERDEIFQILTAIYAPEVAVAGGRLRIYELDNMDFAGFAYRNSEESTVEIYKGVRYHSAITKDSYAMLVCHELGHHLGGLPLKRVSNWAAAEGQADYFATLKCMRRYYEVTKPFPVLVGPLPVMDYCYRSFGRSEDIQFCLRGLMATQSMGAILYDLAGNFGPRPDLGARDPLVVVNTNDSHPSSQCRVDTFRSGALCPVPVSEKISFRDIFDGVCGPTREPDYGRPACWFAPRYF